MRKQLSWRILICALSILAILSTNAWARRLSPDHIAEDISTNLSFDAANDLIIIKATLNGKGPFRFLLDTGASHHVMTPELADSLGLKARDSGVLDSGGPVKGNAQLVQVAEVGIGTFKLTKQSFFVTPFPARFQFQGFLGAELFKHFVVCIDFRQTLLTLTVPRFFHRRNHGIALPIRFHEGLIPQLNAEVDGNAGLFKLDTGYNGSLALFRKFIDEHQLLAKYNPRKSETGVRTLTEETNEMPSAEIREFKLGPLALGDIHATFFLDKEGSNSIFAGAVGTGVLKKFIVSIDYEKRRLILESGSVTGCRGN